MLKKILKIIWKKKFNKKNKYSDKINLFYNSIHNINKKFFNRSNKK